MNDNTLSLKDGTPLSLSLPNKDTLVVKYHKGTNLSEPEWDNNIPKERESLTGDILKQDKTQGKRYKVKDYYVQSLTPYRKKMELVDILSGYWIFADYDKRSFLLNAFSQIFQDKLHNLRSIDSKKRDDLHIFIDFAIEVDMLTQFIEYVMRFVKEEGNPENDYRMVDKLKKVLNECKENNIGKYDVFLSHNTKDKAYVQKIGEDLKKFWIRPWLDMWELRPGVSWQSELAEKIEEIKSGVICIGKHGSGPWQNIEIKRLINKFVYRNCPVIIVILPGCEGSPELPSFLEEFHLIDFRNDESDNMKQLCWGITGSRYFPS